MKIAKKCGCYIFRKTLKNLVYAHLREIRMNQVISAHANFNRTSKILGSVLQRKFIRECCDEKHFSGHVCYLKISAHPQAAIFVSSIDTEKLINTEGLFLVNLARISIQDSQGCCSFQLSLVYNRVCWDFVWCDFELFSFENEPRGLSDFPGHFSGRREDGRLVFAWFWGSGARGRGRLGWQNQNATF